VVVTVNGLASNGVTFTVIATGTIAGTITRTSDGLALSGALVEALQAGIVKASATTAANGTYSMTSVITGTYDVRASAIGYQTKIQNGVTVTTNSTTTVNQNLDAVSSGDINYTYDPLGRVVSVVSPTETATYAYDSVGNLLSVSRQNSNLPSITAFTPASGAVGASVTIYGTAFSSTPGLNAVKFNGVTATVVSASTTQIVTSVPAGATTGTISVNTPTGLATSSAPFSVTTSMAPTITSFTPTIGTPGTALTITGTKYDTTIANDWVTLNSRYALVSSATSTSISTAVPALATSGRISVSTPAGTATSAADFFVPPDSAAVSDVQVTGRMNFGDSRTVAISTANKIGLILFDGTALQRASLKVNSFSMTTCTVTFYNPDGTLLVSTFFVANGGLLDTPLFPATGTYTIVIDPWGANTGSINFTLYDATDATGTITPGGPPVTVTTTTPGQNVRLSFLATPGQRVSLQFSDSTFSGCLGVYEVIKSAGGETLASNGFCTPTGFVDTVTLLQGGYYTLMVDPQAATIGSQTIVLNDVPPDVTGSITPGGSPVTITTTTPGQNAVLTFSGTAGQRVSLQLSGSTFTGCIAVNNTIRKPDGTTLISSDLCAASGFLDTAELPVTGTYSILINPVGTTVGSETLLLNAVPADATASITPGGSPVTLTTTVAGQNGQATFSGSVNQRISLNVTGVSITGGANNWVTVTIKKPDGTTLASSVFDNAGGFIDLQTLPVAGTYTVVADFWTTATGTVTLTLYDVPADITASITPGGSPVTITNTTPGQSGVATFSGTASQQVSLNITGVSLTGGYHNWVNISIKKPDGSTLVSGTYDGSGGFIGTQTLPTTGTYTILVDPWDTAIGSVTLTLNNVP
jgi:YD repeat-containing protein